jgi:hypothetical protein
MMKKCLLLLLLLIFISFSASAKMSLIMVGSTGTSGAPAGAPTLTLASLDTAGTTLTLLFSEAVTKDGANYSDADLNVDCDGGGDGLTVTYASGAETNTLVYTMAGDYVVGSGETCNLDYTEGVGDSLEALDDNADVAAFNNSAITNASDILTVGRFENSDTITTGTPKGYNSNADQTWTVGAQGEYTTTNNPAPSASGSYNFHTTGVNAKYASIDTDVSASSGTVEIDLYFVTSVTQYARFVEFAVDGSNYILLQGGASNTLQFIYYAAGNYNIVSSAAVSNGTWMKVTVKWRASGDPKMSIQIDAGTPVTAAAPMSGTFAGSPSTMTVGQSSWASWEIYADNVKLYNAWQ